jgi:hypothetical protein
LLLFARRGKRPFRRRGACGVGCSCQKRSLRSGYSRDDVHPGAAGEEMTRHRPRPSRRASRAGENECPTTYPSRHVFYAGTTDTRDCTACTCGDATGATCSIVASAFSDAACSVFVVGVMVSCEAPSCLGVVAGTALGSKSASVVNVAPGYCVSSGGEATKFVFTQGSATQPRTRTRMQDADGRRETLRRSPERVHPLPAKSGEASGQWHLQAKSSMNGRTRLHGWRVESQL